jgi:hypothetical protein
MPDMLADFHKLYQLRPQHRQSTLVQLYLPNGLPKQIFQYQCQRYLRVLRSTEYQLRFLSFGDCMLDNLQHRLRLLQYQMLVHCACRICQYIRNSPAMLRGLRHLYCYPDQLHIL